VKEIYHIFLLGGVVERKHKAIFFFELGSRIKNGEAQERLEDELYVMRLRRLSFELMTVGTLQ